MLHKMLLPNETDSIKIFRKPFDSEIENREMDFSQSSSSSIKWSNLHHFFLKRGLMGAGASSFTSFGLRSVSSSCMWKWTSHIFRKISSYQCHKVLLRFRREESLSDIGKWHTKKTERMQELRSSTVLSTYSHHNMSFDTIQDKKYMTHH